jgi:MoxR-like ATPase
MDPLAYEHLFDYVQNSLKESNVIDEVRSALAIAIQVGQPVLLWGAPGEGKTSLVEQVADLLGRPCEVVIGSLRESSDFSGIPMRIGNGVTFAPPTWALRCLEQPTSILFLDELTTADVTVQNAMLRVVHERTVGELVLPSTVAVVAAANPPDSAVGGNDLSAPLANRFLHLAFETCVDEWIDGMKSQWTDVEVPMVPNDRTQVEIRWRSLLVAFINHRPELLRKLPTRSDQQGLAWPSPRSWDHAARVAAAAESAGVTSQTLTLLVVGLVGQGPAMEFLQFARTCELQEPEMLLSNPSLFDASRRTDLVMTTLRSVTEKIAANCTKSRWDAAWELVGAACASGLLDVGALPAMELMKLRKDEWAVPESLVMFADILSETRVA